MSLYSCVCILFWVCVLRCIVMLMVLTLPLRRVSVQVGLAATLEIVAALCDVMSVVIRSSQNTAECRNTYLLYCFIHNEYEQGQPK